MTADSNTFSILFLTVGSGNPKRIEETLYAPISKSISQGDWKRVVLLPSQDTLVHAREIASRHSRIDVHVRPLPQTTSENNADACYDHFQHVIGEFTSESPHGMAVDITRGTKAMSAALMLAAFRHGISSVRYVEGERDPENPGVIIPGSERVRDIHADAAIFHRTLDEARLLFHQGDFAATAHLLSRLPSAATQDMIRLAQFYSAWDRLDYLTADEILVGAAVPAQWKQFLPSQAARKWVHRLAQRVPTRSDADYSGAMVKRIRLLLVDLLANGERRIRQRQFEDAVLRAYRVIEMIGQARLFEKGLNSAALPHDHPQVTELQAKLRKKGSAGFGINRDGTFNAGRELVARLLKGLKDPLAPDLLGIADAEPFRLASRNHSILIHGFAAVGPSDEKKLRSLYEQVVELLAKDNADAQESLMVARSLDFSA